jgi:hypothetical protein
MRQLFLVLAICTVAVAMPSGAQSFQCGVNGANITVITTGSPFLAFTPATPNATQTIVLTGGSLDYHPISAVAAVQGNAINITFTASYLGFATPPALSCGTARHGDGWTASGRQLCSQPFSD